MEETNHYYHSSQFLSIDHSNPNSIDCSKSVSPQSIKSNDRDVNVIFTYSIEWKTTDIKWSSRWDYILGKLTFYSYYYVHILYVCCSRLSDFENNFFKIDITWFGIQFFEQNFFKRGGGG